MPKLAAFVLVFLAAFAFVLQEAEARRDPISLEVKYSIAGFNKLNWEIKPESDSEHLKPGEETWALANPTGASMLAVATYSERDFGLACRVLFPKRVMPGGRISVFFNYQFHEAVEKSTYAELRLYPDGKWEFGHTENGYMRLQQEGRFPFLPGKNREVKLHLAKLRNELHFSLNEKRSVIKVGIEAKQGGFGFSLPPQGSVTLRDFKFTVFREIDRPFAGVDVIGLFAPKSTRS